VTEYDESAVGPPAAPSPPRAVARHDLVTHERLLFRIATAIVVVHVLADAFVFLQPGVGGGRHLLRGLLPAALLVLAAALYPRLRPGLRASVALVVGALAVVWGGISAITLSAPAPRGAVWTGLLLLPAGVALLVLGIVVLWRSRRREGGRAWRYARRALYVVAGVFVLYWVVMPLGFALFATHHPREAVVAAKLGLAHRDVVIRTDDNVGLRAWYVPSHNGAAVITFPRTWTTAHARLLARHGYGVLALDLRGYGTSDGDPNAYGWGSAADLRAAVDWLAAQPDVRDGRIGGLGLSVGGEQLLEAAAVVPGLRAVVAEGASWNSVRETSALRGPSALQKALQYPQDLMLTIGVAVETGRLPGPSLRHAVARIAPRAVFLIYGQQGQETERDLTPVYYDAAGRPKELWAVPGAGHTAGITAQPAEYERRVIGFFDRQLLGVP